MQSIKMDVLKMKSLVILIFIWNIESGTGEEMRLTPPNQLVASGALFAIKCETPENYLNGFGYEARFKIFQDGHLIKDFPTRPEDMGLPPNEDPHFSLVHDEVKQSLGVKYEKKADLNDGGTYECLFNNSSMATNLTIVKDDSSTVFVEKGSPAEFSCVNASSLNDTESFDCHWYVNGEEQNRGNCSSWIMDSTDLAVPDITCKVALRRHVEAAGGINAVPDRLTVTFNKSLAVVSCDKISRTAQPKCVMCRVRGNVQPDLQMWFMYNGTYVNSSCDPALNNSALNETMCEVRLPSVDLARFIVEQEGELMSNITLTNYMEEKRDIPVPNGGPNLWWISLVVVGAIILVVTGVFYWWKRQWWLMAIIGAIQKCWKRRARQGDDDVNGNGVTEHPADESHIELMPGDGEAEPLQNGNTEPLQNGNTEPV